MGDLYEELRKLKEQRYLALKGSISRGRILKFHFPDPVGKVKRAILIGIDKENESCAFVLINTSINGFVANSPSLSKQQYTIDKSLENYLEYQSYVDCSKLHVFNLQDVTKWIVDYYNFNYEQHDEIINAKLSQKDLAEIRLLVNSSITISEVQKRAFIR